VSGVFITPITIEESIYIMPACSTDLVFSAEVVGTTSTVVGSARIETGDNTSIYLRAMMGTSTSATASLQMRRFSDGATVLTVTGSGLGLRDVLGPTSTISGLGITDGWYDFHLSGSAPGVNSIVKGIRIVLE
tara:strand:+ start:198 stop:596 length:399 start_codon:yes stop_codon:yes gene_type:complete